MPLQVTVALLAGAMLFAGLQVTPAIGTSVLAGRVVDVDGGRGISGATVTLTARTQRTVIADANGRFVFAELPAGVVSLQVVKPGYTVLGRPPRLVELAAGEKVLDAVVRLMKLGAIAGAVRDDGGDPIVGLDVMALRRTMTGGRAALESVQSAQTDDRGMYRLHGLRPGDYVICACRHSPIPFDGVLLKTLASEPLQLLGVASRALNLGADVATLDATLRTFPPTFFPTGATPAQAARVTVTPGEDRSGVDITLTAVRAAQVSGVVTGGDGPLHASSIRLVPAGDYGESGWFLALQPMLVQPGGRFDFAGVPPGQYVVRVTQSATSAGRAGPSGAALAFLGARGAQMSSPGASVPGAAMHWAAEPITVPDDGLTGLSIQLRAGVQVSGRLEFDGASARPAPQMLTQRAFVSFLPMTVNSSLSGWVPMTRITEDGTFQGASAIPGPHIVMVQGTPGWTIVKSITVNGIDVTDLPLDIDGRGPLEMLVTLTDARPSTIEGTLAGAAKPFGEELVAVAFPIDERYWATPAAAQRRFRATPLRPTGTFTLAGLPPGDYFVAVLVDDGTEDWQDRARLSVLSRAAQRVVLAAGSKSAVQVRR